jgi:hypothetical protein
LWRIINFTGVNAQKLSLATAVQLVIDSAPAKEIQEGVKKGEEKSADLSLAQKRKPKSLPYLAWTSIMWR